MRRESESDEPNQRVVKIKAEKAYDPNWRPLRRTADNMTPEGSEGVRSEDQIIPAQGEYAASYTPTVVEKAMEAVKGIVERALSGKATGSHGRETFADYLPVTDEAAKEIEEKTGLDVRGYVAHSDRRVSVSPSPLRSRDWQNNRPRRIILSDGGCVFCATPSVHLGSLLNARNL